MKSKSQHPPGLIEGVGQPASRSQAEREISDPEPVERPEATLLRLPTEIVLKIINVTCGRNAGLLVKFALLCKQAFELVRSTSKFHKLTGSQKRLALLSAKLLSVGLRLGRNR